MNSRFRRIIFLMGGTIVAGILVLSLLWWNRIRPRYYSFEYVAGDSHDERTSTKYAYQVAADQGYTTPTLGLLIVAPNAYDSKMWCVWMRSPTRQFVVNLSYKEKIEAEYQIAWK